MAVGNDLLLMHDPAYPELNKYDIYDPQCFLAKKKPHGEVIFHLDVATNVFNISHIYLYNRTESKPQYTLGRGHGLQIITALSQLARSLQFSRMQLSDTQNYLLCHLVYEKINSRARYLISDLAQIEEETNVSFSQYPWFKEDTPVELVLHWRLSDLPLRYTFSHEGFQADDVSASRFIPQLQGTKITVYDEKQNILLKATDIIAVHLPNLNINIRWYLDK